MEDAADKQSAMILSQWTCENSSPSSGFSASNLSMWSFMCASTLHWMTCSTHPWNSLSASELRCSTHATMSVSDSSRQRGPARTMALRLSRGIKREQTETRDLSHDNGQDLFSTSFHSFVRMRSTRCLMISNKAGNLTWISNLIFKIIFNYIRVKTQQKKKKKTTCPSNQYMIAQQEVEQLCLPIEEQRTTSRCHVSRSRWSLSRSPGKWASYRSSSSDRAGGLCKPRAKQWSKRK